MSLHHLEWSKIGFLVLFCLFLACLILFLSFRFIINRPDSEKSSSYECGFEPYEDARNVFDIRFYLIAILFLIFDLETVFFIPWCISMNVINTQGFLVMIDFIIELLVGFIYAWEVGALDWN
jgi:NADH-quinone oxidoreductase subunit A